MSQTNDAQLDKIVFNQSSHFEIHTPAGKIPAPASDAPIVSGRVVPFSAGKSISPLQIVLSNGTRISNPA